MKAGIIYKTDISIMCDRTNILEQVKDMLDDSDIFSIFDFSNEENLFSVIHSELARPGVTSCNIYEVDNILFVGYFIDMVDVLDYTNSADFTEDKMKTHLINEYKRIKLNVFASQISAQHVSGSMIIVKYIINYDQDNNGKIINSTMTPTTTSQYELEIILSNIIHKTGVFVTDDGSINEYSYIANPLENLIFDDPLYSTHYSIHDFEMYSNVLSVVVDTRLNETNSKLNVISSLITRSKVYGTAYFSMYRKPTNSESPCYFNLSVPRFNGIYEIRSVSPESTCNHVFDNKEYILFDKLIEYEKKRLMIKSKSTNDPNNLSGCLNSK
jgi:hypothetical protein